jgi:hypothetical protein
VRTDRPSSNINASGEQAQGYLDDFLENLDQKIAFGNIEPCCTPDDYRVAPVHRDPEREQEAA